MDEDAVLEAVRDPDRFAALQRTDLLDTEADPAFDRLTRLVQRVLDVPTSFLSLVDEDRQFYKSCVGLGPELTEKREAPLSHSYCKFVVARDEELVVEDARTHPLLRDNPAIEDYDAIAYLGIPLRGPDGYVLGTLCALDQAPRPWSEGEVGIVRDLAASAQTEIELRADIRRRERLERELSEREETLRQIAENLEQVVWMSTEDKSEILFVNDSYREIWGRDPRILEEEPLAWMEAIHPEDRERVAEAMAEQVEGDYDETYRVRTPEGEVKWVRDRAFPVEAGDPEAQTRIVGIADDVTREVEYREELEEAVRERTRQLERAQREILERLAAATEYRDDTTGAHTRRVGVLSERIARQLGRAEEWVQDLRTAAPLHDVGKVAIPDRVLLKEAPLTDEEYEVMKRHAEVGADLLSGGASGTIRMAETVARSHHERWDGEGYPSGLEGEEIPLAGRIVALADAVDAITHDRPYSDAAPIGDALAEVEAEAGRQFDPEVAGVFLEHGPGMVHDLDE